MPRARLTVRNMLMVYQIKSERTVPSLTLFGVDLRVVVPADTEFPRTLPQLDVFTRLFVRREGVAYLRMRLQWDSGRERRREQSVYQFTRQFAPTDSYQDATFRLPHLRLPGEGWYRLVLSQFRRPNWQGKCWVPLASDVFYVEKRK
jgi:hypothetical protein